MTLAGAAEPEYLEGTQGPWRSVVDYILGVTHEIWESRQFERIHDYYSPDCVIYTPDGIVRGSGSVVRNTRETLEAFPDRLLLGDAVLWAREAPGCFYSSHRITSPMTNLGTGPFGPPTGRRVVVVTIADCLVENGVITTGWLVRDNYGLARQLGLEPRDLARRAAAVPLAVDHARWLQAERARVRDVGGASGGGIVDWADDRLREFCESVLRNAWINGDARAYARHYHPYAVLHDSRPVASGLGDIARRGQAVRHTFKDVRLCVDHVCARPDDRDGWQVAARWSLVARQHGEAWGLAPANKPVFVLGVTHWKIVAGRIASDWTIFDRMAVLTQLFRPDPG